MVLFLVKRNKREICSEYIGSATGQLNSKRNGDDLNEKTIF